MRAASLRPLLLCASLLCAAACTPTPAVDPEPQGLRVRHYATCDQGHAKWRSNAGAYEFVKEEARRHDLDFHGGVETAVIHTQR